MLIYTCHGTTVEASEASEAKPGVSAGRLSEDVAQFTKGCERLLSAPVMLTFLY